MIELYTNISDEVKRIAEVCWDLCCTFKKPEDAAKFLNDALTYYEQVYTEEEVDFIKFYFHMKMEMMKE